MKEVVLVTGASSGFGLLTAQALARAGHAGTPQPCSQNPRIASATAAGASRCGK